MTWLPSDIVSAISAGLLLIAVCVSLYLGIRSLRLTNKLEEKKYRLELLNELIQWAIDVLVCSQTVSINEKDLEKYKAEGIDFSGMRDIAARNVSISRKVAYFKNKNLDKILEHIEHLIMLCHNSMLNLSRGEGRMKKRSLSPTQLRIIREDFKIDDKKLITKDIAASVIVGIQIDSQRILNIANDIIEQQ